MHRPEMIAQTSMSFWWPRVADLPVPKPRTMLHPIAGGAACDALEGTGALPEELQPDVLNAVVHQTGLTYPLFLRTDYTSGKHAWSETCFVAQDQDLLPHIGRLLEASLMIDVIPDAVVFREYVPLAARFTAFVGALPIAPERRYFVRDGVVICHHPYWPAEAIRKDTVGAPWDHLPADWEAQLAILNQEGLAEVATLTRYAQALSRVLPGVWSVDFAKTAAGGWMFIDAARAEVSWHPEDCPSLAGWRN